jgi:hypothetical protein
VIDLRKTPASPSKPVVPSVTPPSAPKPTSPLTFTKPIEKPIEPINPYPIFRPLIPKAEPPLIEAEPHKITPPTQPATNLPRPPIINKNEPPVASGIEPQYIIRPPGLAPTDFPRNILDLKRDKGEF